MRRQNIVITDAGGDFGRDLARVFASWGRNLALFARHVEALEPVRRELAERYPALRVLTRSSHGIDRPALARTFRDVTRTLGSVDRVIVNIGVGGGDSSGDGNCATNVAGLQTNVLAGVLQCEVALPLMRRQGSGHLVVLSSAATFQGICGNMSLYAASKAAVGLLGDMLSPRLGTSPSPVVISLIYPAAGPLSGLGSAVRVVEVIEAEPAAATVPTFPWLPPTSRPLW